MQIDFEHSCKGKTQYPNKKQAIDAATNIQIQNEKRMKFGVGDFKNLGKVEPYFCTFCCYWHVGHKTWRRP